MARRLIVEIVGDASSLQRALASASTASDSFGTRMSAAGEKISAFGAKMTRDITLPIVGIGAASVKTAVSFQDSMEKLHTQAGVSQQAVDSLSKSVVAMAGSVGTGPEELSQGIYHLASQGLRGKQALDALRVAAEGAKLGGANLEDVTNALGASIVSGIKGTSDYTKAMGQLNAIVGAGDMRMQDLADAMGTGLPAKAALAGVSLRDVGAALAVFGDNNIRGAEAGTQLNSTLRLMAGPSTAAAKAMGEVGLKATQLGEDLRSGGIVKAISDLKDHLAGLSKTDQFAALTHMFGGRQAGGVMILIDQLERLKTKEKEVADGGSSFASDWQSYTKTTAFHLASMGAQMQATGVTIGDVLLPVVAKLADVIGSLAAKFENLSPSTRKFILIGAGIAATIGPVVGFVGHLTSAIGGLSTAFSFLAANPIVLVVVGIAALAAAIAAAVIWPDKLKSILEKMGLSAHAAGEVVDGLRDVFHGVQVAGEALVGVIRANWSTISAIVSDAIDIVKTTIQTAVAVITALWKTFGGTLTAAAKTTWGLIKTSIHDALEAIRGVVDIITGLIHGDWSKVWKGIKEIVSATLSQIGALLHAAVSLLGDAASLIGEAIWKGIIQPVAKLAAELLSKVEHAITSALEAVARWVVGEAEHIGSQIVHGITNGIGDMGGVKSWIEHKIHGILSSLNPFSPVEHGGEIYIGKPIADGAIAGYLLGIRPLEGKISTSLRSALEQARATVRGQQSTLAEAWKQLADNIVSAFDKETELGLERVKAKLAAQLAAIKSKLNEQLATNDAPANATSSQLAAMQVQDQQIQIAHDLAAAQQQVADAQTAVNQAQASGDPSQVAAAQQQLADAEYNLTMVQRQQQEFQLQQTLDSQKKSAAVADNAAKKRAAKEEAAAKQHAQRQEADYRRERERQKKSLEDRLKDLGKSLEQGKTTWAKAHAGLVALMKSEGVDYQRSGKSVGEQFAAGIRKSMGSVESAMQELTKLVAQYLPHSPAEKGPLSKPVGWGSYILPGLGPAAGAAQSILSSAFATPTAYGAGASAAGRGGGSLTVHVHVPQGFVGSANELGDAVAVAVTRSGLSGHPLWRQVVRQATA